MKTPQLETERLLIKPLSEEHIDDWFEMDSDPEVHTYISQSPVQSKDEIREALKFISQQYKDNGVGRWAVVDKNSGEMLGWCGLKFYKEPLNGHAQIYEHGYRFKQKHWGKGLATESSKAVLDWGFENLGIDTIYAITDPENLNSQHVLKKLGFHHTGNFDWEFEGKKFKNCYWFELSRNDFHKLP
ncbi:GNAT family N-acetyltransferase [Moheibacter stercoris]|uniref:RimJ/RimL family protein N-acetyltransferase n=1 Tax=Moheibacter stercoris TaxID=1628251 RepID=A0ABV2LUU8_9FLAO